MASDPRAPLTFLAMGCSMEVVVAGDGAGADDITPRVAGWFHAWERQLSRFSPDSDLAALNRSSGRPAPVRPTLWRAVKKALAAARWTGGLVTPTLLAALERAGYDRTFEHLPSSAPAAPSGPASPAPDWRGIVLEPRERTIYLPPGLRLDLGGTAKGWGADRAAARLARRLGRASRAAALVNAGGDIAVTGPRPDGLGWRVAVTDPLRPERTLLVVEIEEGAVATSSRTFRRWTWGGAPAHHILDPRTGEPARTDVLSATVVGRTAWEAEVAAKVVLILGRSEGLAWIERHPTLAALAVLDDGSMHASRRLDDYLWL